MTNTTNRPARKAMVFGYLDQLKGERLPLKKFLKANKMTRPTFFKFEGEYNTERANLTKREKGEHQEGLRATVMDAWDRIGGKEPPKRTSKGHEIVEISEDERLALARKVYLDAMAGGASAKDKDLAVRMLGMLIEKREVKVGLTADEIARRNFEADKELSEWRKGRGRNGNCKQIGTD